MKVEKLEDVYQIYEEKHIGSVETIPGPVLYIENIYIDPAYRGKGYLRKIIEYFPRPIVLLPLPEHLEKFKHLGFKFHEAIAEDQYYILI